MAQAAYKNSEIMQVMVDKVGCFEKMADIVFDTPMGA
jgi:hypothetical protein